MSDPSFVDNLHKVATNDIVNFVKRIWNGGKVKPINGNYVNYHDPGAGSLASYCTIDESNECYATEKNPLYDVLSTPQDSGLDGYFKELNIDIVDRKAYLPESNNNINVEQNDLKYDDETKKALVNLCFTWDFEDTYKMLEANSRKIIPRELKTPPERCCYY